MDHSTISELHLHTLGSGIPALPSNKAAQRMEACIWCLIACQHTNGVLMVVKENGADTQYRILWREEDIDRDALFRGYNEDDGPEHGAEAIALLLIRERTDYTAVNRSVQTTGIDYWLGYKTDTDNQIFSKTSARLEISGILRQSSTNKPSYRAKIKTNQTKQSDDTFVFPVYVIIVEFSIPTADMDCRHG